MKLTQRKIGNGGKIGNGVLSFNLGLEALNYKITQKREETTTTFILEDEGSAEQDYYNSISTRATCKKVYEKACGRIV